LRRIHIRREQPTLGIEYAGRAHDTITDKFGITYTIGRNAIGAEASLKGVTAMASQDEILKAWDEAVANFGDDPTDAEIAAAEAIVCAECPGVTHDDILEALRAGMEKLKGEVAAAERVLKFLEAKVTERGGKLPGLPGGPSLKN
jgi:hypothetical protein